MTNPSPNTPSNRTALKILATVVAGVVVLFLANSARSDSQDAATSISTQSLLSVPLQVEPAAPTQVPTTAPIALPTATPTPAPVATLAPTATATPTAIPTATAAPKPEPTATASVQIASADAEPAPEEAPVEQAPVATAAPEPTPEPTAPPEPTATPEVVATPEPTPTPAPTAAPIEIVEPTPEPTLEPTPAPTAAPVQSTADLEAYVLGQINTVRANAGLGPIALDPNISAISRDWSQQMAVGGFFQHRPGDQLNVMLPAGWRRWGENIASAPDIIYAQDSLEASPGHYANMVGPFTHVGIGVFSNGSQVWVTQNFALYE